MNVFSIYVEQSGFQMDRIESDQPFTEQYVQERLSKAKKYNPSRDYWAAVRSGDVEKTYRIKGGKLVVVKEFNWGEFR